MQMLHKRCLSTIRIHHIHKILQSFETDLQYVNLSKADGDVILSNIRALHETYKIRIPLTYFCRFINLFIHRHDLGRSEQLVEIAAKNLLQSNKPRSNIPNSDHSLHDETLQSTRSKPIIDPFNNFISFTINRLICYNYEKEALKLWIQMSNDGHYTTNRVNIESILKSLAKRKKQSGSVFNSDLFDKLHQMMKQNQWHHYPSFYTQLLAVQLQQILLDRHPSSLTKTIQYIQKVQEFYQEASQFYSQYQNSTSTPSPTTASGAPYTAFTATAMASSSPAALLHVDFLLLTLQNWIAITSNLNHLHEISARTQQQHQSITQSAQSKATSHSQSLTSSFLDKATSLLFPLVINDSSSSLLSTSLSSMKRLLDQHTQQLTTLKHYHSIAHRELHSAFTDLIKLLSQIEYHRHTTFTTTPSTSNHLSTTTTTATNSTIWKKNRDEIQNILFHQRLQSVMTTSSNLEPTPPMDPIIGNNSLKSVMNYQNLLHTTVNNLLRVSAQSGDDIQMGQLLESYLKSSLLSVDGEAVIKTSNQVGGSTQPILTSLAEKWIRTVDPVMGRADPIRSNAQVIESLLNNSFGTKRFSAEFKILPPEDTPHPPATRFDRQGFIFKKMDATVKLKDQSKSSLISKLTRVNPRGFNPDDEKIWNEKNWVVNELLCNMIRSFRVPTTTNTTTTTTSPHHEQLALILKLADDLINIIAKYGMKPTDRVYASIIECVGINSLIINQRSIDNHDQSVKSTATSSEKKKLTLITPQHFVAMTWDFMEYMENFEVIRSNAVSSLDNPSTYGIRTSRVYHSIIHSLCGFEEPRAISLAIQTIHDMNNMACPIYSDTLISLLDGAILTLDRHDLQVIVNDFEEIFSLQSLMTSSKLTTASSPPPYLLQILPSLIYAYSRLFDGFDALRLLRFYRQLGGRGTLLLYHWVINAVYNSFVRSDKEFRMVTEPKELIDNLLLDMSHDGLIVNDATIARLLKLFTKAIHITKNKKSSANRILKDMELFMDHIHQNGWNGPLKIPLTGKMIREMVKAYCVAYQEEKALVFLRTGSKERYNFPPTSECFEPLIYNYGGLQGLTEVAEDVITMMILNNNMMWTENLIDFLILSYIRNGQYSEALDKIQEIYHQSSRLAKGSEASSGNDHSSEHQIDRISHEKVNAKPSAKGMIRLLEASLAAGDVHEARRVVKVIEQIYSFNERQLSYNVFNASTTSPPSDAVPKVLVPNRYTRVNSILTEEALENIFNHWGYSIN